MTPPTALQRAMGQARTPDSRGLGWATLVGAAVIWIASLSPIGPDALSDVGLISALPAGYWVALALLSAVFVLTVLDERPQGHLAIATLVTLAVILYGTPSLTHELARFNTTYVHLGFVEAIAREQRLFPELDARFSWPIFFAAAAMISELGRFSLLDAARWIPLGTMLLAMPGLWLLLRAFTTDRRLVVGALWFFLIGNWVGQDYFSPQGLNLLLYIWFLGLVAWYLGTDRDPPWLTRLRDWIEEALDRARRATVERFPATAARIPQDDAFDDEGIHGPVDVSDERRVGMLVLVTGIVVASAVSHQLTPFAMLGASMAVLVVGRTRVRWLPVIVGAIAVSWVSFAAQPFLLGNLDNLISQVGDAGGSAQQGVAARVAGSPGHTFVVIARISFSLAIWGLGALGALRRLSHGHWDVTAAVLAVAPLGLVLLQSYGGEVFIRAFLYSLPATSFLVAAAIMPIAGRMGLVRGAALATLSFVLILGFIVARYGNERADMVTSAELATVDALFEEAPFGSALMTVNFNSPVRYRYVDKYDHLDYRRAVRDATPTTIADDLEIGRDGRIAFLLLTRGQGALEELIGLPAGRWASLIAELDASPRFEEVARTHDGVVYRLVTSEPAP